MTEGTEHFRKHIGRWNGGCPKFNNLFVRADKFIENMIPDFQHGDCRIIEIISLRGDVQFLCGAGNELIFIPFLEDELVIVTPVTPHYLEISKENVTIAAFLNEPFILREKGSGTKKAINQYLEQQHIASGAINVVARMNDLEAVKRSIINGLGISILSAKSVQDLNASRQVLIFPLAHLAPTRKLYIV